LDLAGRRPGHDHRFHQGQDVIDLRDFAGFSGVGDLTMTQQGWNTLIDFGGGNTLYIQWVPPHYLTDNDFLFA
jgi:hypothetical protein